MSISLSSSSMTSISSTSVNLHLMWRASGLQRKDGTMSISCAKTPIISGFPGGRKGKIPQVALVWSLSAIHCLWHVLSSSFCDPLTSLLPRSPTFTRCWIESNVYCGPRMGFWQWQISTPRVHNRPRMKACVKPRMRRRSVAPTRNAAGFLNGSGKSGLILTM